jgi:hypothetical protein
MGMENLDLSKMEELKKHFEVLPKEDQEKVYNRDVDEAYVVENMRKEGLNQYGTPQLSSDFGFNAYVELTGKKLGETLKTAYPEVKGVTKGRSNIWCGTGNFETKNPVRTPEDYIKEVTSFIEELNEESAGLEPESGKKQNYDRIIKEAKDALNGFGKAAMENGDSVIAQKIFKYTGYDQKIPGLEEILKIRVEEYNKQMQKNLEQKEKE